MYSYLLPFQPFCVVLGDRLVGVERVWNVMAHAPKPDFVFRRNGRVHLNRQSTTGSRGVRLSGINAGYTMFRSSEKGTGYPLYSPVSPSLPLTCVTVFHHVSTALYLVSPAVSRSMKLSYLLTYLLHGASWAANRFSASQETPRIWWNPKVYYQLYKCPPPVPVLSQINPIHALHPTSCRSILILSFHLRLGLSIGPFPSGFPTTTLYIPLFSPIRATFPSHIILHVFFSMALRPNAVHGLLILEVSRSHTTTHHSR